MTTVGFTLITYSGMAMGSPYLFNQAWPLMGSPCYII
jgi:hypothetical protein